APRADANSIPRSMLTAHSSSLTRWCRPRRWVKIERRRSAHPNQRGYFMHRHAFSARFAVWTLAISLVASAAVAQQRPGEKRRGDGQEIPQTFTGYSVQNIQGFTVIINQNVLEQDVSKFERKPLE